MSTTKKTTTKKPTTTRAPITNSSKRNAEQRPKSSKVRAGAQANPGTTCSDYGEDLASDQLNKLLKLCLEYDIECDDIESLRPVFESWRNARKDKDEKHDWNAAQMPVKRDGKNEDMQVENKELKEEIRRLENEAKKKDSVISNQKEDIRAKEDEIARYKEKSAQEARLVRQSSASKENERLTQVVSSLQNEIKTLKDQLAEKNTHIFNVGKVLSTTGEEEVKSKQTEIDRLQTANATLKEENEGLKMKLQKLATSVKSSYDEEELRNKNDEIERLKQENTALSKTKTDLARKEAEIAKLQTDISHLQTEKEDLDKALSNERASNTTASNNEKENLKKKTEEIDRLKMEMDELKRNKEDLVKRLETKISEVETENKNLKRSLEEESKARKDKLTPDVRKLTEENDMLKNRLSQLAGSKLTEGNPAIADLSDPNRPISLGEKFSELYDNQWTDALEELTDEQKFDERKAIDKLAEVVKKAYEFCARTSDDFLKDLRKLMKKFSMDPDSLPQEVSKQIKDHRKAVAVSSVQGVQEAFCKQEKTKPGSNLELYYKQCIAVCWFMTVQDPPVYMEVSPPKGDFDTDRYKAYTKTGKHVDFLVWPVLYLHKGGPMLSKGVAQGK